MIMVGLGSDLCLGKSLTTAFAHPDNVSHVIMDHTMPTVWALKFTR